MWKKNIYIFLTVIDEPLVVEKILVVLSDLSKVSGTRRKIEAFFKKIKFWKSNVLLLHTWGLQYCTSTLSHRNKVKNKKFLSPKWSLIRHLSAYKNEWNFSLRRMFLDAINLENATKIVLLKLGGLSPPPECSCHCIDGEEAVAQAAIAGGLWFSFCLFSF